ncbi:hypothetical protein GCM10007919_21200 [Rhizobium indigoferae]|nr:hypothetical protein GCM10007919_21200 [Rhizobium indigoferae]
MLRDEPVDPLAASVERAYRSLFIQSRQAAVADYVSGHDRGKLPIHHASPAQLILDL